MAVEIGALRAMLSLDSAAFERGARRAEASMGNLQRRLSRLGQGMRRFGRSMSTRVTAPLVLAAGAAVRSSLQIVDAQAKLAQTLDTSVVSIQNLTRAASLSGISQEELEGSLTRMTRRISLAAQETGPAVDALDRLGLSAENLNDLPVDQRVDRITSAIRDLIPEAEQAGIASQIFGDRTGLAIMRLDSDVIARATEEVERFGVAISETDADQIEATNDALSAMGLVTKGIANQLTVALAPALQSMAERLADVAVWFKSLSPEMRKFTGIAVAVAAAIGPIAIAIGFMATGFAALASPIGLVIFALAAAAGAAAYVVTQWDELAERFPILERVANFGSRIADAWSNLPAIKWALLIPVLKWTSRFIPPIRWAFLAGALAWRMLLKPLAWTAKIIPTIRWAVLAGALRWPKLVKPLVWTARLIPRIGWVALAGTYALTKLVRPIAWTARLIPGIGWLGLAGKLSWRVLIRPLLWTARLIPGIGWALLAGELAWRLLVNKIAWPDWIKEVNWFDWITKINWTDWIPTVDWSRVFGLSALRDGRNEMLRELGEISPGNGIANFNPEFDPDIVIDGASEIGQEVGRDLADGLGLGLDNSAGAIADSAAELSNYLENALRTKTETQSPSQVWMRIGQDLIAGLAEGLTVGTDAVVSAVLGVAQAAEETIRTATDPSSWMQIGRDLIAGLVEGLSSGTDAVRNAVRRVAQAAEAAIRAETDTRSPSRDYMQIGQDLMAGLGLGISGGVAGAVDAAQGAAEGVTDALSGIVDGAVDAGQAAAEGMGDALSGVAGAFDSIGQSFKTILSDMLFNGKSFADSLSGILGSLATNLFNAGFDGLWNAITASVFPSASGNVFNAGSVVPFATGGAFAEGSVVPFADGGAFAEGRVTPFADGGAFAEGRVTPFATGGVVSSPTFFPMSGDQTGLMGEAGPEAIMPLKRGPGGLGVVAHGEEGKTILPLTRGADGKLGVSAMANRIGNSFAAGKVVPFASGGVFGASGLSANIGAVNAIGAAPSPVMRSGGGTGSAPSGGASRTVNLSMTVDARGADQSIVPRIEQMGRQVLSQVRPMIDEALRYPDIRQEV